MRDPDSVVPETQFGNGRGAPDAERRREVVRDCQRNSECVDARQEQQREQG